MTFSVTVLPSKGQFEAALLVGSPDVRTCPRLRRVNKQLLNELAIVKQLDGGELVALDVNPRGLGGLFGKYRDDPALREICKNAYRDRDASVNE